MWFAERNVALVPTVQKVEFQGGVGVGNRCVRADLPLPSTVLRERLSLAARAHVARHLAATPLALLRWFLAKMASTAAGAGGPFPNAVTTNHQSFADHDHVEDAAESEADVVNGGAVGDHDELMERSEVNTLYNFVMSPLHPRSSLFFAFFFRFTFIFNA